MSRKLRVESYISRCLWNFSRMFSRNVTKFRLSRNDYVVSRVRQTFRDVLSTISRSFAKFRDVFATCRIVSRPIAKLYSTRSHMKFRVGVKVSWSVYNFRETIELSRIIDHFAKSRKILLNAKPYEVSRWSQGVVKCLYFRETIELSRIIDHFVKCRKILLNAKRYYAELFRVGVKVSWSLPADWLLRLRVRPQWKQLNCQFFENNIFIKY